MPRAYLEQNGSASRAQSPRSTQQNQSHQSKHNAGSLPLLPVQRTRPAADITRPPWIPVSPTSCRSAASPHIPRRVRAPQQSARSRRHAWPRRRAGKPKSSVTAFTCLRDAELGRQGPRQKLQNDTRSRDERQLKFNPAQPRHSAPTIAVCLGCARGARPVPDTPPPSDNTAPGIREICARASDVMQSQRVPRECPPPTSSAI